MMKSGKGGCEVAWLNTSFFLLLFATTSIPSTTATVSYSDHCASVVPEATPTHLERGTLLSIRTVTSQYQGGERILGKNSSFSFYPSMAVSGAILTDYATSTAGVYTVKGRVSFSSSNSFYLMSNSTPRSPTHSRFRARLGSLSFQLNGLWSQSSGKLCVVGSGSWYTKEGYHLNLDAVLKLNFAQNSSISTSLVTGLLESLSFPNKTTYFEPISILAFPPMKQYQYTLLSEESVGFSGADDVPTNSSLSLRPGGICSMLSWRFSTFKLKYESKCMQNCTPLGDTIGYVPSLMSLYAIQCSEDEQKLRYLIEFPNNSYVSHSRAFDHTAALVGEGTWDGRKNQLAVVACRILDATGALSSAHLGDCSIRLSLWYPATWSIGKSITIEGQIWTNKTTNDSGQAEIWAESYDDETTLPLYLAEKSDTDAESLDCEILAKRSTWRMGFEITMVLISNTLICIFAGLQLFYLKKHPECFVLSETVTQFALPATASMKERVTPSVFYTEHCASFVPEAVPTVLEESTNTTFLELGMSHYSRGDMILGRN
ncbi:hypothetical protein RJ639_033340 [Escallonia herrerae]|uniref:DUF2921 domain-containing protein n=1 Tax=Escallonia herrerae TaxID=1293975 RepID=A0AA88WVK4_9ASTE|nr:hypothetical protein RJ639_033340 [Escallonia herrerae]